MSIKKRISARLGLLALIVGSLAGCGGGGGGGGGVVAPAPAGGGIAAAFQDGGGSITGVTVNSPPMVSFKVADSSGKTLSTLTASNVSLAMAQLVPAVNNTDTAGNLLGITPARWVPLVTRVRDNVCATTGGCLEPDGTTTAKGAKYKGNPDVLGKTYVQGTTDVKAGGFLYNPDGTASTTKCAPKDASGNAVVDSTGAATNLKFDASTGVYTYYFCTDVKQTLDPVTAAAAWNSSAAHRVAIQLNYTDPVTLKTVHSNPYVDFTVDSAGNGNQWKDAAGNLVAARQVIDKASCNECHYQLTAHGSRVEPNYCVMCHNPSSTDNRTANPVDFKVMIHKFHMGEELANTYQVQSFVANKVRLPQDPRNCSKCHDGASDAVHKTTDGDNWLNNPSRKACGACHDTVDFALGTNHPGVGGVRTDDTQCKTCHTTAAIATYHRTTVATPHNPTPLAGFPSLQYKITGTTINASRQLVVDFQILSGVTVNKNGTVTGGTPVLLNTFPNAAGPLPGGFKPCDLTTSATFFKTGATFKVAFSTAQDGIPSPSDWNMGHDSLNLCEAWAGMNGNALAVQDAATNTYRVTMVNSTFSVNTTTLAVTAGHSLAVPADAKMVTAVMSDGYILATVPGDVTNPTRPEMEFAGAVPGIPSLFTATGNTPDGKANIGRRTVMDVNKCNNCHDRLGSHPWFHTGNYAADMGPTVDVSVAMCAICHTPNQGGSTGWTASTRAWVHGIHAANATKADGTPMRSVPFTWHGVGKTDNYYTNMTFPGVIKNCQACHLAGTYDFSASQYTDTLMGSMLNVVANTGVKNPANASAWVYPQQSPIDSKVWAYGITVDNVKDYGAGYTFDKTGTATNGQNIAGATTPNNLVSSPIVATCASCHDSLNATNHMKTNGGKFYDVRGAAQVNTEACLTCHGKGKTWAIATVHAP